MSSTTPRPTIGHDRHGSGEPLVLIHGLGATRRVWGPQIEPLAAERDLIVVDMPGFGASPRLDHPPTAAAMGAAITGLCRSLGIERPHVAGNSLGGWVALEIAKAGHAASACLISPAGLWREPLGAPGVNVRPLAKVLKPALLTIARLERPRHRMLSTVVGQPANVPTDEARAMIGDWIDAPGYDDANEQMRRHVFEGPEHVEPPVTIAWGEHDRLVAPPKPERRPPGSDFLVLENCGHTPNWDDPELLTQVLLEASSAEPAKARRAA